MTLRLCNFSNTFHKIQGSYEITCFPLIGNTIYSISRLGNLPARALQPQPVNFGIFQFCNVTAFTGNAFLVLEAGDLAESLGRLDNMLRVVVSENLLTKVAGKLASGGVTRAEVLLYKVVGKSGFG